MSKPEKIVDGLLVLHCQNGDKKAFSLLVKRWHIRLCKQAFWYTKDKDMAKDIAQESWSVILRKMYSLKEPNNFGAWALTIVNRKSIDWFKKKKREENKLHQYYENSKKNYDTIDTNRTNDDHTEIVLKTIHKLPENQQIILRLFYVEDYSILEISKILGVSKGTVKSRLFYAREKLKSILKNRTDENQ